jgi:hypothetical protein
VDTLPRSGARSDVTLRSDRDSATAAALPPQVARSHGVVPGITAAATSRGRVRSPASDAAARQTLANAADQLLAEARAACLREAVPASKQELLARIAARIGLPEADVAESLRLTRRRPGPTARSHVDDPMIALAASILGRREHTVFLARRTAPANDAHTLHQLATDLGVSIERIYQLEASALHKLATALR